jgi:hypothetical protein
VATVDENASNIDTFYYLVRDYVYDIKCGNSIY